MLARNRLGADAGEGAGLVAAGDRALCRCRARVELSGRAVPRPRLQHSRQVPSNPCKQRRTARDYLS
eukprot:2001201-Rhodomonas_salina.4